LSSGVFAGQAAARLAREAGGRSAHLKPLGRVGLRPSRRPKALDLAEVREGVRAEMHPFDKNLFRTAARLNVSRNVLDSLWTELADHAPTDVLAWREAAALVAAARWSVATAERRNESRGMHRREDFPEPKAQLAIRLLSGGLDRVWVAADGESPSARSSQLEPAL